MEYDFDFEQYEYFPRPYFDREKARMEVARPFLDGERPLKPYVVTTQIHAALTAQQCEDGADWHGFEWCEERLLRQIAIMASQGHDVRAIADAALRVLADARQVLEEADEEAEKERPEVVIVFVDGEPQIKHVERRDN